MINFEEIILNTINSAFFKEILAQKVVDMVSEKKLWQYEDDDYYSTALHEAIQNKAYDVANETIKEKIKEALSRDYEIRNFVKEVLANNFKDILSKINKLSN